MPGRNRDGTAGGARPPPRLAEYNITTKDLSASPMRRVAALAVTSHALRGQLRLLPPATLSRSGVPYRIRATRGARAVLPARRRWALLLVSRAMLFESPRLTPSRRPLSHHGPVKSALFLTSGHSPCPSPMIRMRRTPPATNGTRILGPGMPGGTGSLTMPAGNGTNPPSGGCSSSGTKIQPIAT